MTAAGGPTSVLLIEDDPEAREFVKSRLVAENLAVVEAPTGERGLELFDDGIGIVLVDIGLPGIDGFAVVRAIRQIDHHVPILIITGAESESDRVLGLELGADDYVVKPFLPRELIARVRALLRRATPHRGAHADLVSFGDVTIDPHAREVVRDGRTVPLTSREYDLLWFLVRSPRQVFTREQLLRQIWHAEPGWQDVSTVTEHVHRLRRRLERDSSRPRHILTVRGVGYRFDT